MVPSGAGSIDMNDDARTEFGPHLRRAREKRGLSLQQVAATTKISARVLDALERNDISKLPGGIFSRSFVRAYAREVGLDPEETVERFIGSFPPEADERAPAAAAQAVDAEGFESGRRAAITLLQVLGICVLVILAVAMYRSMRSAPQVPPPASNIEREPDPAPAVPAGGATEPPPATPATEPGGQPPAAGAAPVPAEAVAPGANESFVATPETPLALTVLASDECWLSLSVDGQKVVARNLQPGERVQFRARTNIVISAGNAGALTLTINGKPARTLGGRGEVVTSTITLETLKNFVQ
jgi:cytoskeletal protein RodZ